MHARSFTRDCMGHASVSPRKTVTKRLLLASLSLWAASTALAAGMAIGCSSSSGGSGQQGGQDSGGGGADTGSSGGDTGAAGDTGPAEDSSNPGDGGGAHDAPPPDALYGCATTGSFGWSCQLTTSGPDPTDCTDPNYPDCFVGGQGAWCTKSCTGATDCTSGVEDAGCAPTDCNARGYCK